MVLMDPMNRSVHLAPSFQFLEVLMDPMGHCFRLIQMVRRVRLVQKVQRTRLSHCFPLARLGHLGQRVHLVQKDRRVH